jgi:hypothetical protein
VRLFSPAQVRIWGATEPPEGGPTSSGTRAVFGNDLDACDNDQRRRGACGVDGGENKRPPGAGAQQSTPSCTKLPFIGWGADYDEVFLGAAPDLLAQFGDSRS